MNDKENLFQEDSHSSKKELNHFVHSTPPLLVVDACLLLRPIFFLINLCRMGGSRFN